MEISFEVGGGDAEDYTLDLNWDYERSCKEKVFTMIDDGSFPDIDDFYEYEENEQIYNKIKEFLKENDRLYKETVKDYAAIDYAICYTIEFIERRMKLWDFGFDNDITFWQGIKDYFDKTHTEAFQPEIQKLEENISRLKVGKKPH